MKALIALALLLLAAAPPFMSDWLVFLLSISIAKGMVVLTGDVGAVRAAISRTMWKEISTSTPIMCIPLPSKLAGDFTSAPASSGAGLGSAVGVRAPTFQPATGPVAFATPSWMA